MTPAVTLAAAAALLYGGLAQAVNNQPPKSRDDNALQAALVKMEEQKAAAEASALKAMAKDLTPLEQEWGIKLLGIRATAAGYALDFRYKVLDPDKAAPLLQRQYNANPYLVVERSGAKLGVPFTDKAGSLRSSVTSASQIRKGRNYSALFANPGRHVKPGETVTVVFGDFKAEHLTVQ